ncbi:FMN-binding protein [Amnibacterium sp. CER49]|uniref:FMN-binding protein n=1 Tax=Amnibacterium sp. CER49 TaxID=3039161 RepID=UPI002449809A|nr:FMN-binding protein [Amnibacterium sp. CER49]MDH2444233.1 FMN-binding protein [Amnibacterium sp. CER49]
MPKTVLALAGTSLTALALAGCASASSSAADSTTPSAPAPASSPAAASFKDGTYSALGKYVSPGGPSAVDVTLTLKKNVVSAVKVVPKAENSTAQSYESRFASGVSAQVVGRRLDELNVTKVSGSSLTSQGFDRAVEAIAARAKG